MLILCGWIFVNIILLFSLHLVSWDVVTCFASILFSAMYIARGNHESKSMNKIFGFEGEVRSKLNDKFVKMFAEVFNCLPLAHVINKKVFVVHGGLFSVDGVKLSQIRSINRFCEPPDEGKTHNFFFFLAIHHNP
jgi:hypothetical protein